ncbi:MAG: aminotransferase class I/II-fold pyridoxal phosphate-dependent enzyme [Moorea sp. SIO3I7]|uniref:aminotransferase class I/II-fold pyridoxal phosphate-dependent enzyme n=1 Tax=Moorena sp. SIO4A5 TaxID=2607838 RepID=UPI0013CB13EF|nr:aminotransferase class I/II-fold pyridoxal phosphate-dependent enzyme [Moorena sp. SIO4A5]NEN98154.1 aminotransferase class I/II-fold pyridoxal phosphate-dependent enzyme [Moorena sp. SIO3I7]NEO24493.1 aminotransferase class I/II-fold pyridoxal phosphate-dependent enzyme [Moorena sp. SIO4A5]
MKSRSTEEYELFRKLKRYQGQLDLGHSDAPEYKKKDLMVEMENLYASYPAQYLVDSHKVTVPESLAHLGAEKIFGLIPSFPKVDPKSVVIFPKTSTILVKMSILASKYRLLQQMGGNVKPITVIYPEGNFRYNHNIDIFCGTTRHLVEVCPSSFKIKPDKLEEVICTAKNNGYLIAALILETPNNPWCQIYSRDELKELAEVAHQHNILIINDMYFSGTEAIENDQVSVASVSSSSDLVITTCGMRRQFGIDGIGKVGFLTSQNEALVKEIKRFVVAAHIRYTNAEVLTASWALNKRDLTDREELRKELEILRANAEALLMNSDLFAMGMKIIKSSCAGPFVNIGFNSELESRMKILGIADSYNLGEYFSQIGKVTLLPLSSMFTKKIGFRVNVTNSSEYKAGLACMQATIEKINKGVSYLSLETEINQEYEILRQGYRPWEAGQTHLKES